MRQLKLIPSGCQTWNSRVIDASRDRFAYCATLAIYVFDLKRFNLQKLIATQQRTVTSFAWSPFDDNIIVSSCADGSVTKWDLSTEAEIESVNLNTRPIQVEWCPQDSTLLAVMSKTGEVYFWYSGTDSSSSARGVVHMAAFKTGARILRWSSTSSSPVLAVGMRHGEVWIFTVNAKKCYKISALESKKDPAIYVTGLEWDPRSTNYLLAAFSNGRLCLIDIEAQVIAVEFDQQRGITGIAWNKYVPGGFVTVNGRAAVVDIWNVSQNRSDISVFSTPVSRSKLAQKQCGIHTIQAAPHSPQFLLSFKDGSVGVYGMKTKRLQFTSQPGHWETIFDCRYKPGDPHILATSSYDGTIKLWDTKTASFSLEMTGQCGVIYSCVWEPGNGKDRIVSSSSDGDICIWDTRTGLIVERLKHHSQASYRVAWNSVKSDYIVSTSSDNYAVVFSPTGNIHARIKHPDSVFGCDFDPFEGNYLVTGCHDGDVRIFDISQSIKAPIQVLKGHTRRVFNTVWSPLLRNCVASGSDDHTIRVWNTSSGTSEVLQGHQDRVRALIWSTEIPYLLLSGSWDSTIRVWDFRNSTCLRVVQDHHADVYGIASHPLKPFTFASCSRDTSLRIWTLEEDVVARLRLTCLVAPKDGLDRLRNSAEAAMEDVQGNVLCGVGSEVLSQKLVSAASELECVRHIFEFFESQTGLENLFSLAESVAFGKPSPADEVILHVDDVRDVFRSKAKSLESGKGLGFGGGKLIDKLYQAAEILLKTGNVREYCELMVRIGQWERAIAVAPAVSITFWKSLCQRYARQLADSSEQDAVTFWVASGDFPKAVSFFESVGELPNAFLTASSSSNSSVPTVRADDVSIGAISAEIDTRKSVPITSLIKNITDKRALHYVENGDAVLAACCHMAIGDIPRALKKLIRGAEFELAVSLGKILNVDPGTEATRFVALREERLQMWKEAKSTWMSSTSTDQYTIEIARMCARYNDLIRPHEEFYKQMGVRSPASFVEAGRTHPEDVASSVRSLVAGRAFEEAVKLGTAKLRELMSKPHWNLQKAREIIEELYSVPAFTLPKTQMDELLAMSSYLGALMGKWKGFGEVVSALFQNTLDLISNSEIDFPVSLEIIRMQYASHLSMTNGSEALKMARLIIQSSDASLGLVEAAKRVRRLIEGGGFQPASVSHNLIVPTASLLPSGRRFRSPVKSVVTKRDIEGVPFALSDGAQFMSRSEAIMWSMVNQFSPLNTGRRMPAM